MLYEKSDGFTPLPTSFPAYSKQVIARAVGAVGRTAKDWPARAARAVKGAAE